MDDRGAWGNGDGNDAAADGQAMRAAVNDQRDARAI